MPWKDNVEASLKPRFEHNDKCKYIKVFGKFNDWLIIDVLPKNNVNEIEDMEELKKDALVGIIYRITGYIKIGNVGAYMYDKEDDEYGYNLVIWNYLPFTLQEDKKNYD